MDNQIAVRQTLNPGLPTEHEMCVFQTMAKQAVESKMYRGIGEQAGVMMIMLAARELGIPAMQALNGGLNIIQGKVEISARMMSAMIRRAGHRITIQESTDLSCTLVGARQDTRDTATVSYTLAEAQKAGLVKPGGGWVKNPKDMCFARAMSRLARQLFSDVIGIGYIEGEISGIEVEVTPVNNMAVNLPETPKEKDKEATLEEYLATFHTEDQSLAQEYLSAVCKHFEWSVQQAINHLMSDTVSLMKKFGDWKSKCKAA